MKLAAFLCLGLLVAAEASFAQATSPPRTAVRFQPKLSVGAPPPALYGKHRQDPVKSPSRPTLKHARGTASSAFDTEIICGMKVIRKGPEQDPGIIVKPSARSGAAIRRITPPVCAGTK